jgi:hypothetical protein
MLYIFSVICGTKSTIIGKICLFIFNDLKSTFAPFINLGKYTHNIKFPKKLPNECHVVFCPTPDSDAGPEYKEYIELNSTYSDYEVIWESDTLTESADESVIKADLETALHKAGLEIDPEEGDIDAAVEYIKMSGMSVDEWIKETQNNYPQWFKR